MTNDPMEKAWRLRSPSPRASQLAHDARISPLQAQLLINRGISDTNSAISFLTPKLSNITDPMLLKDMKLGVEMIIRAIESRANIMVYGDYDADGLTATALLLNFFSSLDIPASFYVPNRLTEGYGLNPAAVEKIAKRGTSLIITVDCGTANHKEIEFARERGIEVVVTDHHRVPEDFALTCPLINPHRPDSSFPFKHLAGVGLAFALAIAVRRALRERGWFRDRPEPDLKHYLDLVALGTVADMVPLVDQNRILVKSGIERMKNSCWPGIRVLQEIAATGPSGVTPYDLAFKLAPRLNAPGRMGSAEMGLQILTTDNPSTARVLAEQLNAMNSERQNIEQDILGQIEEAIKGKENLQNQRALVFSGKGWHKGVLGIVASRLVDRYHRPALVLTIQDGMATGSGRSIDGFDLHNALVRLGEFFERFGGHYHAVGFVLEPDNVEDLARELERLAHETLTDSDLIPAIDIDAEITLPELTLDTVNQIKSLGPFGPGNHEPAFYAHSLEVIDSSVFADRHLRLRVKQQGRIMEAIGFGLSHRHPLRGETIHMVFTPNTDHWQRYEWVQLRVIDVEVMKDHGSKLMVGR